MGNRMLNTQYFVISLEQIEDIKLLEALNRNCSEKNGISARVFYTGICTNGIKVDTNEPIDCIITGLLINDKKAVIIRDGCDISEIVYFSQLNIDIAFDFESV